MEVFEKSFYFTHLGFEYFQVKFETKKTIFQRSKVTLLLSGQLSIPRLGLCGHGELRTWTQIGGDSDGEQCDVRPLRAIIGGDLLN